MNKKINIALILLIVGLISTMGAANAHPILDPVYKIFSHDVTVEKGETATITAQLWKNGYWGQYIDDGEWVNDALLIFTVKDKNGKILACKLAKTEINWINLCVPTAVCKIDTAKMPKGKHTLTIFCPFPEDGVYQPVTRDYKFKVV